MELISYSQANLPVIIAEATAATQEAFVTFFASSIENPNTRAAYLSNCRFFFQWANAHSLALADIEPVHVAAYRELLNPRRDLKPAQLAKRKKTIDQQVAFLKASGVDKKTIGVFKRRFDKGLSAPTIKQHLSALKMLFDFMVERQCMAFNPAAGVKPPRHVYRTGKTPKLTQEQTRQFFDSIDGTRLIDYRDRALVAVMMFSFARISAAVGMRICDFHVNGHEAEFRLIDKGGIEKSIPAHHLAARYVSEYIHQAGFDPESTDPLFRSFINGKSELSDHPLNRKDAWKMIKRRARKAGLTALLSNHSFRGTGVTNFLENGGDIHVAQELAGHADVRTTKLYDGRKHEASKSDIERIRF
ncbi:tyrosine-type recombinase/integrase [Marinicella sediminis]|uniref:Tyrosine-type recombinase/integrase n=1 Tax=Marinicella sediminis TaxID=1792834 RepID=A0ABV7JCS3_9GAMM|nr:tyrosine-type recombinase/integrase [Marinicella sediminis]